MLTINRAGYWGVEQLTDYALNLVERINCKTDVSFEKSESVIVLGLAGRLEKHRVKLFLEGAVGIMVNLSKNPFSYTDG